MTHRTYPVRRHLRRWALITLAAAMVAPTTAAATPTVQSASSGQMAPQPWQTWIDTSLVPVGDWPLELHYAPCPDDGGDACYGNDSIWVAPSYRPGDRRYRFLHELGHWFDEHALNDRDRQVFQRIAHSAGEWEDDSGEVFADAFAACARWRRLEDDRTGQITLFAPGHRTYQHVCEWMRVIAARYVS